MINSWRILKSCLDPGSSTESGRWCSNFPTTDFPKYGQPSQWVACHPHEACAEKRVWRVHKYRNRYRRTHDINIRLDVYINTVHVCVWHVCDTFGIHVHVYVLRNGDPRWRTPHAVYLAGPTLISIYINLHFPGVSPCDRTNRVRINVYVYVWLSVWRYVRISCQCV